MKFSNIIFKFVGGKLLKYFADSL